MNNPIVRCPTCQKELEWTESARWRPFCSERCRMVDLGAWFSEERAIAGEAADPTDPAAQPEGRPGEDSRRR